MRYAKLMNCGELIRLKDIGEFQNKKNTETLS